MVIQFEGIRTVQHLVSLMDFIRGADDKMTCKHCKQVVETGILNVVDHLENCPEHPVFISTGFDLEAFETVGYKTTWKEYKSQSAPGG